MKRLLAAIPALLVLVGCGEPTGPNERCYSDGPAVGMPAFDVVTALGTAGASVEDQGERLEATQMNTPARQLLVDGHVVLWYEYCSAGDAGDDARKFNADASMFDGTTMTWSATPHVYVLAQVILIYEGRDPNLLALLAAVMGSPLAEGS